jgi:hypothetical protein
MASGLDHAQIEQLDHKMSELRRSIDALQHRTDLQIGERLKLWKFLVSELRLAERRRWPENAIL